MPTIGWDETSPPVNENAGLGPDRFHSLKSSIRVGLDSEHVWPSGGGDAGVHRLGTGRAHYGVQSAVSSTGSDGRLMITSDTSRLFGVGSGGTVFFGGPAVLSMASFPGAVPQRHYWAVEYGSGALSSLGSTTVTIPNSGYSGSPIVYLTIAKADAATLSRPFAWLIGTPTATAFTVGGWDQTSDSAATQHTLWWMSVGTRVL